MKTKLRSFLQVLACLCIFVGNLAAQTYKQGADSTMLNLNKAVLTTNVLYDRVFPLAHLQDYTGLAGGDTTNSDHFHQAYYELYNSMSSTAGYQTPENFQSYLNANYTGNSFPIGVMRFKYNFLDTNAVRNNQVTIQNGLLYDVPGRTGSPFIEKTVFIATPLFPAETQLTQGEYTFSIDPAAVVSDSPISVQSVSIDFDDGHGSHEIYGPDMNRGGQQRGIFGAIANFVGKYIFYVRLVVVLADGSTYETVSKVFTKAKDITEIAGCNGGDQFMVTGAAFDGSAYGLPNAPASGKASIFYADANCQSRTVTRPVVFLDGFDPTNDREQVDFYDKYVNKKVVINGATVSYADYLRAQGYDLIVFDYDDGGDLIERNGLAVEKLLQEIYSRYHTTMQQDIVLVGSSMGALVGQYALAHAQANNIDVHTRVFISFDGPHKGANAPLALQQTLDYLLQQGLTSVVFKKFKNGFHRVPAGKQMIIHHSSTGSETTAADGYRAIFLNNLAALNNYPTNMRKVAIINASGVATPNQLMQSGGEMLYFQVKRAGLLGLISGKLGDRMRLELSAGSQFSRTKSMDMWLFSPLLNLVLWRGPQYTRYVQPAGNNFAWDTANASYFGDPLVPGSKTEAIADFTQTLLFLLGGNRSTLRHNINPSFIPATSSMDLQSGTFEANFNIANGNVVCNGKTPFDIVYYPKENQEHVQITSENANWLLDEIRGTNRKQPVSPESLGLSISGPIGSGGNTTYSVNLPAGAAVKWEINAPYAINGSNTANPVGIVIPSYTNTYTELIASVTTSCYEAKVRRMLVPPSITTYLQNSGVCGESVAELNVPPGAEFTWSATGDVSIEGLPVGQPYVTTSNSVSVTGINGYLSVSFKSYGNTVTANKYYAPYVRQVYVAANPMIGSDPLSVMIQNIDFSYNSINWYLDGNLIANGESFYDGNNPPCGYHNLAAMAELPCGQTVMVGSADIERLCGGSWRLAMYPNPVSDTFTVAYSPEQPAGEGSASKSARSESESKLDFEVKVFTDKGSLVKSFRNERNGKNLSFSMADLPNGNYFIHVINDKKVTKKQIIVQH